MKSVLSYIDDSYIDRNGKRVRVGDIVSSDGFRTPKNTYLRCFKIVTINNITDKVTFQVVDSDGEYLGPWKAEIYTARLSNKDSWGMYLIE